MAFNYTVKAHPTKYNGVQYRSRLEARWAAFFDLIGWQHEYEPIDLPGWSPDFRVVFPSTVNAHVGINEYDLFAEVKPYYDLKQFNGHASCAYMNLESSGAVQLGANPEVARAWFNSGNGWDGLWNLIGHWPDGYSRLWSQAGNAVQWHPKQRRTKRQILDDQVMRNLGKDR